MYRFLVLTFLGTSFAFLLKKDTTDKCLKEKIFELQAGKSIMKISANGGRIISFRLGNTEIITNKSEHENFGSTLWTAPQSDWGWPPHAILDKEEYTVSKIGDTLKMISKPDLKSGLQFEKKFTVPDGNFIRIEYLIRNISKKTKKVAAWEVTRVSCGGLAFFPSGSKGKVPESTLKIDLLKDSVNWILIDNKPIPEHQKLFATASKGWLGYAFNDMLFIKQFPDTNPEDYSPMQGEIEIYSNKEKSYAELENHGEYTLLPPAQALTYVVNWYLQTIPQTLKIGIGNAELFSFARKQININYKQE